MKTKLNRKEQLALIDGLCLLYEDGKGLSEDPKIDLERAEKIIGKIYKISHLNGLCENPHMDWHKEGIELGEKLREWGFTDYQETKTTTQKLKEKGVVFSDNGMPRLEKHDGKTKKG